MGCRDDGDHICRNINIERNALLINIREMRSQGFGIEMGTIEIDEILSFCFHLIIYCTCNNISWRKASALIVFLHELDSVLCSEYTSKTSHGFSDQKSWFLHRIIEGCG